MKTTTYVASLLLVMTAISILPSATAGHCLVGNPLNDGCLKKGIHFAINGNCEDDKDVAVCGGEGGEGPFICVYTPYDSPFTGERIGVCVTHNDS